MPSWRMAKSLDRLLAQVNAEWPRRRKDSDGGIGNTEHSARESDHNPDTDGVVKARDFTHDPASGCDSYKLAQALLDSRDTRIKYIISNRRIAAGTDGPSPWKWRPYNGKNPHNHHCHVSVKKAVKFYDDARDWDFSSMGATPPVKVTTGGRVDPAPVPVYPMTLLPRERAPGRKVMTGAAVKQCQQLLGFDKAEVDGRYGSQTAEAVRGVQRRARVTVDGVVGPQTWALLLKN